MLHTHLKIRRILQGLIVIAASHSILLGIILIIEPYWLLNLVGWIIECDPFFLRQVGVFHILLGLIYWREWSTHGSIFILALAKLSAVVFLTSSLVFSKPVLGVFLAGATDLLFAAGALYGMLRISHLTQAAPK
jgi:hypothetical protein